MRETSTLANSIDVSFISQLYHKYQADLLRVRAKQASFYEKNGYLPGTSHSIARTLRAEFRKLVSQVTKRSLLRPQLDDLEAEITYLLVRETRPEEIVEISPCKGWSSTWILQALRDNDFGRLSSYDIVDYARRFVPSDLAQRWEFHLGPAQENTSKLPSRIDYLFIDSDHSADFARWYIDVLFPRLRPGTPVSVHDVYHTDTADGFDHEGKVIVDWLERRKVPVFTASGAKNPKDNAAIRQTRADLGMAERIHRSEFNSMIYFRAP